MITLSPFFTPWFDNAPANLETLSFNCLNENLRKANIGHRIVGDPTLFDVLFLDQDVKNYRDTKKADIKLNALFNKGLRMRGIFKSSAKIYPSLAISDEDLFNTKKAIHDTVLNLV